MSENEPTIIREWIADTRITFGGVSFLTPEEHDVVQRLGTIFGDLCAIVGDGPTRDADLTEMIAHIHALQRYVMGQAAARLYPSIYRLLGEVGESGSGAPQTVPVIAVWPDGHRQTVNPGDQWPPERSTT